MTEIKSVGGIKRLKLGRDVFSTGHVAKLCGVSPRTVAKWLDKGLIKGHRIPGSLDRRFRREDLETFMKGSDLDTSALSAAVEVRVLTVAVDETLAARVRSSPHGPLAVRSVQSAIEGGVMAATWSPLAVVIDGSLGLLEAARAVAAVRAHQRPERPVLMVAVVGEDSDGAAHRAAGFDRVFHSPVDPHDMAAWLAERLGAGE